MAKPIRIAEGVYMLAGIASRQYLVSTPDSLILIDAGLPGNGNAVFRALAAIGKTPSDLKQILITHADLDHYGAVNEIRTASGAAVYASRVEAEAMRIGGSSRRLKPKGVERLFYGLVSMFFHAQPTQVENILTEGECISGLTVLSSAGHTPGHVSFFLEDQKVLFAGDSIQVQGGNPAPSAGGNTWDADLARQSYRQQMDFLARTGHVCCGHGYCRLEGGRDE